MNFEVVGVNGQRKVYGNLLYFAVVVSTEKPNERCVVGEPGWEKKRAKYVPVYVWAETLPDAYAKAVSYWMKQKGRKQLRGARKEYLEVDIRRATRVEAASVNLDVIE